VSLIGFAVANPRAGEEGSEAKGGEPSLQADTKSKKSVRVTKEPRLRICWFFICRDYRSSGAEQRLWGNLGLQWLLTCF
jgi:hypothetical protein